MQVMQKIPRQGAVPKRCFGSKLKGVMWLSVWGY